MFQTTIFGQKVQTRNSLDQKHLEKKIVQTKNRQQLTMTKERQTKNFESIKNKLDQKKLDTKIRQNMRQINNIQTNEAIEVQTFLNILAQNFWGKTKNFAFLQFCEKIAKKKLDQYFYLIYFQISERFGPEIAAKMENTSMEEFFHDTRQTFSMIECKIGKHNCKHEWEVTGTLSGQCLTFNSRQSLYHRDAELRFSLKGNDSGNGVLQIFF